jgi:hypothetical protein
MTTIIAIPTAPAVDKPDPDVLLMLAQTASVVRVGSTAYATPAAHCTTLVQALLVVGVGATVWYVEPATQSLKIEQTRSAVYVGAADW